MRSQGTAVLVVSSSFFFVASCCKGISLHLLVLLIRNQPLLFPSSPFLLIISRFNVSILSQNERRSPPLFPLPVTGISLRCLFFADQRPERRETGRESSFSETVSASAHECRGRQASLLVLTVTCVNERPVFASHTKRSL